MAVEIKTLAITLVHGIVALASVVFATNAVVLFAKFISSQHEHSYGPQYKHTKRMSTASDAGWTISN
ncbi:hypothetical protein EB796_020840 [Bugula neritina]|uniref:Uncharacterized protein n=1 Tax=Bugula neritina TaxID=10212 RepID=A0A7J7J3V5_BUGNE|nr:hypothetical protein EB796_020840 [Bugula neritina]